MASDALICAHQNEFNQSILNDDAFYFDGLDSLSPYISRKKENYKTYIENNRKKIETTYSWERIAQQYSKHFKKIISAEIKDWNIGNHQR